MDNGSLDRKDSSISDHSRLVIEPVIAESDNCRAQHAEEPVSLISFETTEAPVQTEVIRQLSPPPVLAEVQDLIPALSPHVTEADCTTETPSSDEFVRAETPLQLHIVRVNNLSLFYVVFF